jgi:hypothetical protein
MDSIRLPVALRRRPSWEVVQSHPRRAWGSHAEGSTGSRATFVAEQGGCYQEASYRPGESCAGFKATNVAFGSVKPKKLRENVSDSVCRPNG